VLGAKYRLEQHDQPLPQVGRLAASAIIRHLLQIALNKPPSAVTWLAP
jgi:hypothetical protein